MTIESEHIDRLKFRQDGEITHVQGAFSQEDVEVILKDMKSRNGRAEWDKVDAASADAFLKDAQDHSEEIIVTVDAPGGSTEPEAEPVSKQDLPGVNGGVRPPTESTKSPGVTQVVAGASDITGSGLENFLLLPEDLQAHAGNVMADLFPGQWTDDDFGPAGFGQPILDSAKFTADQANFMFEEVSNERTLTKCMDDMCPGGGRKVLFLISF